MSQESQHGLYKLITDKGNKLRPTPKAELQQIRPRPQGQPPGGGGVVSTTGRPNFTAPNEPLFPELLYKLLMEEEENQAIYWAYDGEAFMIKKEHPLLHSLLRKYFSHGKFKSLQRQLNIYGFKKGFIGSGRKYRGAIYHPHFQKGKKEDLVKIKRRPPPGRLSKSKKELLLRVQQQKQQAQQQPKEIKLGTRKRKVKNKITADTSTETDSLIREAALAGDEGDPNNNNHDNNNNNDNDNDNDHNNNNDGKEEEEEDDGYYYGSDISTTANENENENSTLGEDGDHMDVDPPADTAGGQQEGSLPDADKAQQQAQEEEEEVSGKVLKLDFNGEDDDGEEDTEKKEQQQQEPQEKSSNRILLPYSLKKVMIKTWENISMRNLVQDVPARISVRKALQLYLEAKVEWYTKTKLSKLDMEGPETKAKVLEKQKATWKDLTEGIAVFFDKALPTRLLYQQELPQFKVIQQQRQQQQEQSTGSASASSSPEEKEDESSPKPKQQQQQQQLPPKRYSDIYGCEHLLRMLLRLPDILGECIPDEETRRRILRDVMEFVRFLHRHQDILLLSSMSFRNLTPEEMDEIQQQQQQQQQRQQQRK